MPVAVETTTDELKEIRKQYILLRRRMSKSLSEMDRVNIDKAYDLAVEAHKFQRRKSGEPYILHPIEVGRICYEEIGLGPTAVICAILHDVVEDTEVTQEQILAMFGPKISRIVDGLTKLDGLYNVCLLYTSPSPRD